MLDRLTRVVNVLVALARCRMETKLHLINTIGESKEWEVSSLDSRDELFTLAVVLCSLVERGDCDEVSELLGCSKLAQLDSFVHFVIEGHIIESFLEIHSMDLVIDECLLGREEQVLL